MDSRGNEPKRLCYSIKEASRVSTLGRSTLYRAIAAGHLRVVRVGGRTVVPVNELHAFMGVEGE